MTPRHHTYHHLGQQRSRYHILQLIKDADTAAAQDQGTTYYGGDDQMCVSDLHKEYDDGPWENAADCWNWCKELYPQTAVINFMRATPKENNRARAGARTSSAPRTRALASAAARAKILGPGQRRATRTGRAAPGSRSTRRHAARSGARCRTKRAGCSRRRPARTRAPERIDRPATKQRGPLPLPFTARRRRAE